MADPVKEIVETGKDLVKKPVQWFKGSKLVFVLFVVVVLLVGIRFRNTIAGWLVRIPKFGPWLVGKVDGGSP